MRRILIAVSLAASTAVFCAAPGAQELSAADQAAANAAIKVIRPEAIATISCHGARLFLGCCRQGA